MQIRTKNVELTAELKDHIDKRMAFAFGQFAKHIRALSVTLEDANGPRGGVDQICRIHLRTFGFGVFVLQDQEVDIFSAVSKSADRLSQTFGRYLERKHRPKRETPNTDFSLADYQ